LIERVIENWLTSVSERGYEIPFCQLLALKGHRVLHLSSHGPQEQGKDIITIAPDGVACGYQLKSGNINLTEWRKIRPEIEELLEIPIHHPSVKANSTNHRAYLVTNGLLTDTVRREIHDRNQTHRRRRVPKLEVIEKGTLLTEFVNSHGRFLPTGLKDFRRFLELYLSDGGSLLSEEKFSAFILSILPIEKQLRKSEYKRAFASALILGSYALSVYGERQNHISLINGWVLLASHTLAISEKSKLSRTYWKPTFDLCLYAIERSLADLQTEVLNRSSFVEGDPLTDGLVYRARMTLVLGYVAAFHNYLHLKGEKPRDEEATVRFIDGQKQHLLLWGESAIPCFLSIAWMLERLPRQMEAEGMILSILEALAKINNSRRDSSGLPDPYFSAEACIRRNLKLDDEVVEDRQFMGEAYGLQSLVEWSARRLRRQSLARLWKLITLTSYVEFQPKPSWATYLWRSELGELRERMPSKPQSWRDLRKRANLDRKKSLPQLLQTMPHFCLLFMMVYPHRLRASLVRFLAGC
jgi:hypothetical protein